jgi:hypothetical protein
MPVAPQVSSLERHHDRMAHTGRDLAVAARALIWLAGLVRLYAPHLARLIPPRVDHVVASAQQRPDEQRHYHDAACCHE